MTIDYLNEHRARLALIASTRTALSAVSGVDDAAAEVIASELAELTAAAEGAAGEIAAFASGIPDPLTRAAFIMRYLRGMTWPEIAAALSCTPGACRKMVERYDGIERE